MGAKSVEEHLLLLSRLYACHNFLICRAGTRTGVNKRSSAGVRKHAILNSQLCSGPRVRSLASDSCRKHMLTLVRISTLKLQNKVPLSRIDADEKVQETHSMSARSLVQSFVSHI
jgi:hypothetical protein